MKRYYANIDGMDLERCFDNDDEFVLYSAAQARIEALEWLVECLELWEQASWTFHADGMNEIGENVIAARAAVEDK